MSALPCEVSGYCERGLDHEGPCGPRRVASSSESLRLHDRALAEKVREACAQAARKRMEQSGFREYRASPITTVPEAVRALDLDALLEGT